MPERNWGRIASGETFEALATTIVFFEDPRAALFGRRGADGGQDARSGDGKRVYQAKHHEGGSSAKAMNDARAEAAKITRYREHTHQRAAQWHSVTHWTLVTNATFNPTDHQKWEDEIEPLFSKIGLSAEYWERAHLDALLDKHPEVSRAFFGDNPRAFLSLPEIAERTLQEEPFLARSAPALQGRQNELEQCQLFEDSTALFLLVHGAGGVGKSRLILEAGFAAADRGWQVLWANVGAVSAGGSWFDAVVAERPTIVLVDEPPDSQVLQLLAEQLGGRVGRTSQWKVIVATRSPKDPVLQFLRGPRLSPRVHTLALDPLSTSAAVAMCVDLLMSGPSASRGIEWNTEAATELARRFGNHPVWLTFAVHQLEAHGDLHKVPEHASQLADTYLAEIIQSQDSAQSGTIKELLRWIALFGTLNRENTFILQVLATETRVGEIVTVLGIIHQLVQRRALTQRGASNRLVEIKPDVVRDHLLRDWLVTNVGYGDAPLRPSAQAEALLTRCLDSAISSDTNPASQATLVAIARTEALFRLSGEQVSLLDFYFDNLTSSAERLTPRARIGAAEGLVAIAPFRSRETVAFSRALRSTPVPHERIETAFGGRDVTNEDVILVLGWLLYHAAFGARAFADQKDVLLELYAVTRAEADVGAKRPRGLPNDGRRAFSLAGRILEGGPYFVSTFDDAIGQVITDALNGLMLGTPSTAELGALRSFAMPALAMERHQAWTDGNQFVTRTYTITTSHPGWRLRRAIIDKVEALLSIPLSSEITRTFLWELLAESRRNIAYTARSSDELKTVAREELLQQLSWALQNLAGRDASIDEMKAARGLWEWHQRFSDDAEIRAKTSALEALYAGNSLAREFEPLLSYDNLKELDEKARAKAGELATQDATAIDSFIERGVAFLGTERRFGTLLGVAAELGLIARVSPSVQAFVKSTLSDVRPQQNLEFAFAVVSRWYFEQRTTRDAGSALTMFLELFEQARDDHTRGDLLVATFGGAPPKVPPNATTAAEVSFLRQQRELFARINRAPAFITLIAWTAQFSWSAYKKLVEETLQEQTGSALTQSIGSLIEGIFFAVYGQELAALPTDLGRWLLDQVVTISDFSELDDMINWRLNEVIQHVGRVSLDWLPPALALRAALEAESGHTGFAALSHDVTLTEFVEQIDDPTSLANLAVVEALLDLSSDRGTVGYRLADVLHGVDPHGHVVPKSLAARVLRTSESDLSSLARLSQAYVIETPAWRTIATAVLTRSSRIAAEEQKRSLYRALADPEVRSWSGTPGEVPSVFVDSAARAQHYLSSETEALFVSFWTWYAAAAQADLARQEQIAREERGE
jgi:hypothetical protein